MLAKLDQCSVIALVEHETDPSLQLFPLGLWFVGRFHGSDRHVTLGWAVNGVMTVAGSAAAVALAMLAGFNTVLLVGAGAYGLAAIYAFLVSR